MMEVVFCIGFKDWYYDHLARCLQSIRAHTPAGIVINDLGSRNLPVVRALARQYGASLISNPSEIWSRSRALNGAVKHLMKGRGARHFHSFVFTDADMLFPKSWFTSVGHRLSKPAARDPNLYSLYLTRSRDLSPTATANLPVEWMPQPSDWELYQSSSIHPTVGQGGAMVVPLPWFLKVGGFDEAYEVWGAEDNDLVLRAQWDGLPIEWLPEESAWVIHQYHTRTWPTAAQAEQVKRNRAYLAERIAAKGPVIRNV